jgi:large subunit ribosomal protein L32
VENSKKISLFFEKMAVPKRKTSQSKRNMRRSHHALKPTNVVINKQTGEHQRQHCIAQDGTYKGVQVINKAN